LITPSVTRASFSVVNIWSGTVVTSTLRNWLPPELVNGSIWTHVTVGSQVIGPPPPPPPVDTGGAGGGRHGGMGAGVGEAEPPPEAMSVDVTVGVAISCDGELPSASWSGSAECVAIEVAIVDIRM